MGKRLNKEPLALTTGNLESSGIKTQITHNDVVEIIALQKYNTIVEEIEAANSNFDTIKRMVEDYKKEVEDLFRQELVTNGLANDDQKDQLHRYESPRLDNCPISNGEEICKFEISAYDRRKALVGYYSSYYKINDKTTITVFLKRGTTLNHEESLHGILCKQVVEESAKFEKTYKVSKAFVRKYNTALKEHFSNAQEMCRKYKDINLDPEKLIRETRATFNRQILKAQAPELTGKIQEIFQVAI